MVCFFFISFHCSNHDGKSFLVMHSPTPRPRDIVLRSTTTPAFSIRIYTYPDSFSSQKKQNPPHHTPHTTSKAVNSTSAHHVQNIPHPPNPNSHNPLPSHRRGKPPETFQRRLDQQLRPLRHNLQDPSRRPPTQMIIRVPDLHSHHGKSG